MIQTKPIARYHLIEMTLAARIRDGHYEGGGIPGERALAQEFGAARVTIRSALGRLADQGLIVRRGRRGTFAASGPAGARPRQVLREHLDKFLDRGRRDERKVLSFGFTAASPVVARALQLTPGARVLRVLRRRSDAHGPLTYTEAFVAETAAHALSRSALERKALVQLLEDHGFAIRTAHQTVACEAASYGVAQALGIALAAPVMRLTRTIRGEAAAPLMYWLGWYRADRFEVHMNMSRSEDATQVQFEYR